MCRFKVLFTNYKFDRTYTIISQVRAPIWLLKELLVYYVLRKPAAHTVFYEFDKKKCPDF